MGLLDLPAERQANRLAQPDCYRKAEVDPGNQYQAMPWRALRWLDRDQLAAVIDPPASI